TKPVDDTAALRGGRIATEGTVRDAERGTIPDGAAVAGGVTAEGTVADRQHGAVGGTALERCAVGDAAALGAGRVAAEDAVADDAGAENPRARSVVNAAAD